MASVTKLIDLLNKPALLGWSNKLGLQGIDLKSYQNESKANGINKHKLIEDYYLHGICFSKSELLEKNLKGFEFVGCEVEVSNDKINGRADLIMKKDGETYIFDFKSSDRVYLSTKLQLSTYKEIYNAHKIAVIDFFNFEVKILDINTEMYYDVIKRLYQVNELLNQLNEKL